MQAWTSIAMLALAALIGRAKNLAPNASFEVGTNASAAWSLSSGIGRWESFGRTKGRCVSVIGAGSEEYFNGGWCRFDRKAISGFATVQPDNVAALAASHGGPGVQSSRPSTINPQPSTDFPSQTTR